MGNKDKGRKEKKKQPKPDRKSTRLNSPRLVQSAGWGRKNPRICPVSLKRASELDCRHGKQRQRQKREEEAAQTRSEEHTSELPEARPICWLGQEESPHLPCFA